MDMSVLLRRICRMQVMMSFFIFPLIAINLELTKRLAARDYDFRLKPEVK